MIETATAAIWARPFDLHTLNQRGQNTLAHHLQIEFVEIGYNYLSATMPVDHRTIQPRGILNGGASCALAETLASTAANFTLSDPFFCVGLDINANHLRPAFPGLVHAKTYPLHLGKKTQVWAIDIFNQAKKQVCVARMTMAVLESNHQAQHE